ncbi:MAG: ATP synthase F1 subunit delta [Nitrospirae bacterium]|nr:ATP synthase F1 subunit delta [Candidatus Manganitrophaceae bacterium]
MKSEVVSERYGEALLEVAEGHALAETVLAQIERFLQASARLPDLPRFLENPRISEEKKEALIGRIFEGEAQPILIRFVHLLLRKGRIGYLRDIFALYPKLHDRKRGILKGTLTTAYPLEPEILSQVKSKLESQVRHTLELTPIEDPDILGGFIFSTGTLLIDASVQKQLEDLEEKLKAVSLI